MKEEDSDDETYEIKLYFNQQEFDLSINSDYDETIGKISHILNMNANLLILSYDDEDGDNILLSNEEDYSIFLEQVKSNIVKGLIIELNEKPHENNINENSNININEINYINYDNNEKDNQIGNNINDINEINNNANLFNDYDIKDSQVLKPMKDNNNDDQIEDKIYYYRCSSCDEYPILFVMYYCPECNIYLCNNCGKNMVNHYHEVLKIDSQAVLHIIKDEENEKIENNRIEKEKEQKEKKKKSKNIFKKLNFIKNWKDGRKMVIRKKNNNIIGKSLNQYDNNNKINEINKI